MLTFPTKFLVKTRVGLIGDMVAAFKLVMAVLI